MNPRTGLAGRQELVALSAAPEGGEVRLAEIRAGGRMRARLASMGVLPGMRVRVVRNRGGGPVVVSVHNSRLAIGRGMVHRIFVTPAEGNGADTPKEAQQ